MPQRTQVHNIGVEPNYSLEGPRDDQLIARAVSTGTGVAADLGHHSGNAYAIT
jgi:hypothetical protein